MAVRRSPSGPGRPFVTRRSTLAFSGVCVLATVGLQAVGAGGVPATVALVVALLISLALVTGIVAWIEGIVLAIRAGSVLWTVVAVLPFPPINAVVCAIFCPTAPGERR